MSYPTARRISARESMAVVLMAVLIAAASCSRPNKNIANIKLLMEQANALKMADDDEAALRSYAEVVAADADNTAALEAIAKIYRDRKDYPKTIESYHRLIEADPLQGHYYNELGQAYSQIGDYKSGALYLRKAVALESGDGTYANNLATCYVHLGRNG